MSLDFLNNVESLRCENELESIVSAPTSSAVITRWERKSLKTAKAGVTNGNTSIASVGDRFIPSRSINHDLQMCNLQSDASENSQMLKEQMFEGQSDSKILAFKEKAKPAEAGYLNQLRVLYSQNKSTAASQSLKRNFRAINSSAERILDAPDMSDDFYLNLLDWSSQNTLAVALGQAVYLWNAASGEIEMLTELTDAANSVSSLSWSADGNFLSIGTNANEVQLWNVEAKKQLRSMRGHEGRVGALAWNNHVLTSGSRDSNIFNHDVRIAQHHVSTLHGHTQEVCGLKWSDDGTELASGGNDNVVCLWDAAATSHNQAAPRFSLTQHTAAVKALAWCPWQRHVLATGAGTADRHIRLFNTQTGAMLSATDSESQVSGLFWGKSEKEVISAHGFSQNQLTVWRAPVSGGLQKMADLTGHSSRILHLAMSPDGTTVCSAATDETLRFWKVWDAPCKKATSSNAVSLKNGRMSQITIR